MPRYTAKGKGGTFKKSFPTTQLWVFFTKLTTSHLNLHKQNVLSGGWKIFSILETVVANNFIICILQPEQQNPKPPNSPNCTKEVLLLLSGELRN
jgi:hypothetical protein